MINWSAVLQGILLGASVGVLWSALEYWLGCRLRFHKWSKWSDPIELTVNETALYKDGVYAQVRVCNRCGIINHNAIGKWHTNK